MPLQCRQAARHPLEATDEHEAYTLICEEPVIIAVPAYFDMLERQATKQAGEIAGLDVVEVVPEPVAAAFAYGLGAGYGDKTILIYDLGGGTFDVTLIKLTAESVDVVVVDGNNRLGGRDWDDALFTFLSDAAPREMGDDSLMEDPQFVQDLWNQAEEIKKRLSQSDSSSVVLRAVGGAAKITVKRAEFEKLTAHLVEQTVDITRRALAAAEDREPGVTGRITDVILVGGSTLMPVIASTLKKEFGWDAQLADPHLSVARGAALLGAKIHQTAVTAPMPRPPKTEQSRAQSHATPEGLDRKGNRPTFTDTPFGRSCWGLLREAEIEMEREAHQSRRWSLLYYALGLTVVLLTAFSGTGALLEFLDPLAVALVTLLAAALAGISTWLNPDERRSHHKRLGAAWSTQAAYVQRVWETRPSKGNYADPPEWPRVIDPLERDGVMLRRGVLPDPGPPRWN